MSAPATTALPGYARLSPDAVLDLLDAVGLRGDGRILQLNSFENRVFRIYLEDGRAVVAKFYRPGRWTDEQIVEEHAFAHELVAAEVPVAAPLVLAAAGAVQVLGDPPTLGCCLRDGDEFRFGASLAIGGRSPELDDPDTLRRIGRCIGRLHAVGAARPFGHRAALDVHTFGDAARDAVLASGLIRDEQATTWADMCNRALDRVRPRLAAIGAATLRLHGDCHRGNLLWNDAGPHFVDLDDACTGPAVQDLWMLLDGDRAAMRWQLAELVTGYEDMRDFDWREAALIEPLRTLRMIHHSGWLARRWSDPAFPLAFPWFGGSAYWAQQVADLRDQVDAMRDPQPLN